MTERDFTLRAIMDVKSVHKGLTQIESEFKTFTGHVKTALGAAGIGLGFYEAVKEVGKFNDSIRRTAIDLNMSMKEMYSFKQQVIDTSLQTGVSTDGLIGMSKAFAGVNSNTKFLNQEFTFMARVSKASGASLDIVGEALGEFQKQSGLSGSAFEQTVAKIYSFSKGQGKEIDFKKVLPDLGKLSKYVKNVYGPNVTGAQIGDAVTTAIFTGSPRAVEMALKKMQTSTAIKEMRALGLKGTPTVAELMQRIEERAGGNRQLAGAYLTKIMGTRGAIELEGLLDNYKEFDKLVKETNVKKIFDDANEASKDFGSALNRVHSVFMKIADEQLTGPLDLLSKKIADLSRDPHLQEYILKFEELATAIGGVMIAIKIAKGVQGVIGGIESLFGKSGGKGAGMLAQGSTPANPLYVAIVTGAPGGGIPGGAAAKGLLGVASAEAIATVALPIVGMAIAGYIGHEQVMKQLTSEKVEREQRAAERADKFSNLSANQVPNAMSLKGSAAENQFSLLNGGVNVTTENHIYLDSEEIAAKSRAAKTSSRGYQGKPDVAYIGTPQG